jgi:hypothetical protein
MYGVPAHLDLSLLNEAELIQVCLGQFEVQFHFHPIGQISVADGWELFDESGVSIDHGVEGGPRPPFQLHRLLGQKIVSVTISAPDYLELSFGNGDRLRLIDNSKQYESFTIDLQPQSGLTIG